MNVVGKFISHFLFLTVIYFASGNNIYAQNKTVKIELIHADSYEFDNVVDVEAKRLLGNVQFRHEGADMYCDSAYLYDKTNSLDAYGHVRIVKGDSVKIWGDFMRYNGNERMARLMGNIKMTDSKLTLTTDTLTYNRNNEVVFYLSGGKVVDKENTLTSKHGYYYVNERMVYFQKNVYMYNDRYDLHCDTLKYKTDLKIAYFLGPTSIESKDSSNTFINCEYGWYNTTNDKSYFSNNAQLVSKAQLIKADSILYDKRNGVGRAFGNVFIKDTTQKLIISGDKGVMYEKNNKAWVTGRSTLIQEFDKDSMFMHADTLYAESDTARQQKNYFAYRHVKLFKNDMQAKCDSLTYTASDSMMRFYGNPVLWSEQNQLTADTIIIQMANNQVDKMYLNNLAFISMKEDSLRFNQIKGRYMTAFFSDNKLRHIKVEGNGQTIYYGRNSKQQYVGVNRAECSDMTIAVDSNKVKKITLINKPDATFYPIKELAPSDFILKDFVWREKEKPLKREDIYDIN